MRAATRIGILVFAWLLLLYGIAVAWSGFLAWEEGVEIFGLHARIVGFLAIGFALAIFYAYYRTFKNR